MADTELVTFSKRQDVTSHTAGASLLITTRSLCGSNCTVS